MRKCKLFLTALLLVNSAYADTKPVHFDIGDIAPRQKIIFNVDVPQWPGYHDINCDIFDPSGAAIIRISSNDSSTVQTTYINQTEYSSLPIQIALKQQQNKLTLYKTYNSSNEISNYIAFENLDDDVTISVKNCEISPNAILSADFIYFPSKVTCAGGVCTMDDGSTDKWNTVTASDGTYFFGSASYQEQNGVMAYYNDVNWLYGFELQSKNYIPVVEAGSSWRISQSSGNCSPQVYSPAYCPLKNK